MDDLIKREAALEALEQVRWVLYSIDIPSPTVPEYIEHHKQVQEVMAKINEMRNKIEALPFAEKAGKWKKISPAGIYECSVCGHDVMTTDIEVYRYCPNCGARMEENDA